MALPPVPEPVSASGGLACYDLPGLQDWDAFIVVAETNTTIAGAHADTIIEQKRAIGALIDAGRAQRQVAQLRQEMLEEERRARFLSSIGYWAVIIGLGAAAAN